MKKPSASAIILGNIIGRMTTYSVSPEYLAAAMQMAPRTLCRRMKHPETFNVMELEGAARVLNTTVAGLAQMEDA